MGDKAQTPARILVIDDDSGNVRLLERFLKDAGYRDVQSTTDSRKAPALYQTFQPDLILLDLMMPYLDGVAVIQQLSIPENVYLPVLVLTADVTLEARQRALAAGAKDFLTKPFDRLEVLLRIKNLLDTRRLYLELDRHNRSLEQTVEERTQQFLRSEKLATMGSLLAGVAHELNNPLAVLMGQTHLMREVVRDGPLRQRTEQIRAAAERCARIVRNFLAMARQPPPERHEVSLNQVVREAVELLAYELRTDNIEAVLDLADDLPVLWADAHQLHQVVVNLVATRIRRCGACPPRAGSPSRPASPVSGRVSSSRSPIPAPASRATFRPRSLSRSSRPSRRARGRASGSRCARGSSRSTAARSRSPAEPAREPPSRSTSRS